MDKIGIFTQIIGIMILESTIDLISSQQQQRLLHFDQGLERDFIPSEQSLASHALIISGIRRCGKSTLLYQMIKRKPIGEVFFLNFDTPQLYDFSISDFLRLDSVIYKRDAKILFFDELQLVEGWEMYIRQKLDERYQVVISGSNASLLSGELGSRLTGRYIIQELFPFSFHEFLRFKTLNASPEVMSTYMHLGGFPEYLKVEDSEQLTTLFNDILMRDIVARFGIKEIKSLQRLCSFLIANIGNRITATKLRQPLSIGSTSTILNWFSHLENAYLFSFLPMFSHSVRGQMINSRKVYAIDNGLVNVVSASLTDDLGRKLENLVFLHLRKFYRELYYFDDIVECDFVAFHKGRIHQVVQVCYDLNPDTIAREKAGLLKAMAFFNVSTGVIVTYNMSDSIMENNLVINIVPAHVYLLETPKFV